MTKKVIIIDDSRFELRALKNFFEKNYWQVYDFTSPYHAYKSLFEHCPDLIITDAMIDSMGSFRFLKMLRENDKTNYIPVIIYSVLGQSAQKYHRKQNDRDFYLKKENNYTELLILSEEITRKFPVSDRLKEAIELEKEDNNFKSTTPTINKQNLLKNSLINDFNFKRRQDEILLDFFKILHQIFEYNLFILSFYSYEKQNTELCIDIRNILISPNLKNHFITKFDAKKVTLYKKYAPHLKLISKEEEFSLKRNFNYTFDKNTNLNIEIYSQNETAYLKDFENSMILKKTFEEFFNLFYIFQKSNLKENARQNKIKKTYFKDSYFHILKTSESKNMYFCIIDISFKGDFFIEDIAELDLIKSKTTEKIVGYLDKNEQVYKNEKGGYNIIMFARSDDEEKFRLNCIINAIERIKEIENKIEIKIGACNIKGALRIEDAERQTKKALEEAKNYTGDNIIIR